MTEFNVTLHHGDIPKNLKLGKEVAMDCEMLGLNPIRDKLCLVQLTGDGTDIHFVKFDISKPYNAPNLVKLLNNDKVCKLFHFARVDLATLIHHLGADPKNIYCTKMASRLCRTYTDVHKLKKIIKEFLGLELSSEQQTTYWAGEISQEQLEYAARDVAYLHRIKTELAARVEELGRTELLNQMNQFLPTLSRLEIEGWDETILNY